LPSPICGKPPDDSSPQLSVLHTASSTNVPTKYDECRAINPSSSSTTGTTDIHVDNSADVLVDMTSNDFHFHFCSAVNNSNSVF